MVLAYHAGMCALSTHSKVVGEYMADSSTPAPPWLVSSVGKFDPTSATDVFELSPLDEASSGAVAGLVSEVGVPLSVFLSLSRCSSPSTRFNRASSTSVFGPLFFGTASVTATRCNGQYVAPASDCSFVESLQEAGL